jgi:hypothetical protein
VTKDKWNIKMAKRLTALAKLLNNQFPLHSGRAGLELLDARDKLLFPRAGQPTRGLKGKAAKLWREVTETNAAVITWPGEPEWWNDPTLTAERQRCVNLAQSHVDNLHKQGCHAEAMAVFRCAEGMKMLSPMLPAQQQEAMAFAKTVITACLLSFDSAATEKDKAPLREAIAKLKAALNR